LAKVTIMPPLSSEFFGGADSIELDAGNVFELVGALDLRSPGFAEIADVRVAVAVDDVLTSDWTTPLSDNSDVLLVPRVGGG
jgi:molybdopterin converting factor small subunit